MQDTQQMLATGALVRERYRVKSLIGRGNSGAVYLVEDQRAPQSGQHTLALKEIIGLGKQERVQLTFNSVALRQINHPALPGIHHVFHDEKRKRVCLVMDYVDGPDAETICQYRSQQRLGWSEVEEMLTSIVDALAYLHRQTPPIVHGDVKPVNILLAQPDERYMLVDMSIAREVGSQSGAVFQVTGYKALEQYGKSVDERTDVYGLGATCYTLLTGIVPPNAIERKACLDRGLTEPLQSLETVAPAVPAPAARAIHRSLSIYASERFVSVEEFWEAAQMPAEGDEPTISDAAPPATTETPDPDRLAPDSASLPKLPRRKPFRQKVAPAVFFKRFMIPLVLLAIIVLVSTGAGIWSLTHSYSSTTAGGAHVATASQAEATPDPGGTHAVASPTSSPGTYPGIVGTYAGTIADVPTASTPTVLFQVLQQVGGRISGLFTDGPPFSMSGTFQGTIDHTKTFRFTVKNAAGQPLLFMEGAIQSAMFLSGDYYFCARNAAPGGSCVRSSVGYGIWSVKKVASGG